jgi:aminopeptidase N
VTPYSALGTRHSALGGALAAAVVWVAVSGRAATAQPPLEARHDRERTHHDALHYDVWIRLADSGARFQAAVTTRWRLDGGGPIRIDLDGGYAIRGLTLNGAPASHTRQDDEILVALPPSATGEVETRIEYEGAPPKFRDSGQDDGLVQRGHGASRRIFADNWPDRARKWLAAQDHPSDKATVAWTIEAPAGLTVVANGALRGREPIDGGMTRWRFAIEQPIPVYTMVLGAARLAVTPLEPASCDVRCVPVSVVTYPEDSAWAVQGPFRRAGEMVDFFARLIAPFPYGELRHVETSTIFGGMENSTVIFYSDRAYAARSLDESTVAHETAHQWFGDAATEGDWHHLWLSEGFATYGAALWNEHLGGDSALRATMRGNRQAVIRSPVTERPIIDPEATDLMGLLNSNNYPKGAWVLHTLRGLVGESTFFRGLAAYYRAFEHGTALSSDFARVMSEAAGQDLGWYFEQALAQPGYPVLELSVRHQAGHATVRLRQVQKPEWGTFRLPNLTIRVGGRTIVVPMLDREASTVFHWEGSAPPAVEVDPEGWWLLEVRA